jgi:hypothetical protein
MSLSKLTMLAAAAGVALSVSTFTQSVAYAQDMGDDEAVYVNPRSGKVTKSKKKITAAHHTKAMAKGGREISGAMIYRRGGKLYLIENKPASGGKTLIQEDFQDMWDGNHQY